MESTVCCVMLLKVIIQNSNKEIWKQLFSICCCCYFFFSDLFGLVVFLGIEPYCVKHWWVRLLYRPYCRKNPQLLYSFIAKILWRSAKKDVIDQVSRISFYWLRTLQEKRSKSWDGKFNFQVKSFFSSPYRSKYPLRQKKSTGFTFLQWKDISITASMKCAARMR